MEECFFDFKYEIETPMKALIIAPSGVGKTYRLFKFIEYANLMLDDPSHFQNVIYYYSTWAETFDLFKHLVKEWVNKLPSEEEYLAKIDQYKNKPGGLLLVIDDFMGEMTYDVVKLYTKYARHKKVSVITLWQEMFPKGKGPVRDICRSLSLSATDIIIFKNIRDKSQFMNFAKQYMPENTALLNKCFSIVTNSPFTYMWFDIRPQANNKFRVRSNVCLDEWPMHIYMFDS